MKITKEKLQEKKERAARFISIMAELHALGISQYRIAEDSGIVWNTLWYIQTKKGKYPSARILARLEKYFKGVRTNAKNYCDKRNPKRDRVKMAKGHRMRKTFADAATS